MATTRAPAGRGGAGRPARAGNPGGRRTPSHAEPSASGVRPSPCPPCGANCKDALVGLHRSPPARPPSPPGRTPPPSSPGRPPGLASPPGFFCGGTFRQEVRIPAPGNGPPGGAGRLCESATQSLRDGIFSDSRRGLMLDGGLGDVECGAGYFPLPAPPRENQVVRFPALVRSRGASDFFQEFVVGGPPPPGVCALRTLPHAGGGRRWWEAAPPGSHRPWRPLDRSYFQRVPPSCRDLVSGERLPNAERVVEDPPVSHAACRPRGVGWRSSHRGGARPGCECPPRRSISPSLQPEGATGLPNPFPLFSAVPSTLPRAVRKPVRPRIRSFLVP